MKYRNDNTIFMHDTYIHDFYTVISGFNVECLYNNKVLKFPLNISQEKCFKNWHAFWHFGIPSWNVETPYDKLACLLARWHVKWKVGMLLARKHIGTEAMLPLKHVDMLTKLVPKYVCTQTTLTCKQACYAI